MSPRIFGEPSGRGPLTIFPLLDSIDMPENQSPAEPSSPPSAPTRGEELLPPVEEPNAGFIVQLFILPALIVVVIVVIWLLFNWLVHRTATHPKDLIQGLREGASVARWQRASELADLLRNDRFADFRRDGESAGELARILEREIDSAEERGGMEDEAVTLRLFLARALGEFEVDEGIDVLLQAAVLERDPKENLVRQRALEAIAVRAYNLSQLDPPRRLSHPELDATLAKLADDADPLIRKRAVYALGKLATPGAFEILAVKVDDPDPDTRFNAAIALAHAGKESSMETLAEMLDLEEPAGVDEDANVQDQAAKRAIIFANALEGLEKLAEGAPEADFSPVVDSLQRVAAADEEALARARIPLVLRGEAKRVLDSLPR